MIVSETTSEAPTVKITASGMLRMNLPAPPGQR